MKLAFNWLLVEELIMVTGAFIEKGGKQTFSG